MTVSRDWYFLWSAKFYGFYMYNCDSNFESFCFLIFKNTYAYPSSVMTYSIGRFSPVYAPQSICMQENIHVLNGFLKAF